MEGFGVTAVHEILVPGPFTPGDANFDGLVDTADLGILGANFGQSGLTLSEGDFNGDGTGDIADLGIIGANWTGNTAASALPEPATMMLLVVVTCTRFEPHPLPE